MEENKKAEKTPEQMCFLLSHHFCPAFRVSPLLKMSLVANAVLMVIFALTLWSMTGAMHRYYVESHEARVELLAGIKSVEWKVDHHTQETMQNRSVQSEILGMLRGHTVRSAEREESLKHK